MAKKNKGEESEVETGTEDKSPEVTDQSDAQKGKTGKPVFKPVTYRSRAKKFMTYLPTGQEYDRNVDGVVRRYPVKKKISFDNYTFIAKDEVTVRMCDEMIADALSKGTRPFFTVAEEFKPEIPREITVSVGGINQRAIWNAQTQKYEVENSQNSENQTLIRND